VQFVDVKRRHLCFGRVDDGEGMEAEEIEMTKVQLDDGLMYGKAFDRFNIEGEWGYTHKANAWPITEDLFQAAAEVDWDFDRLSTEDQLALNIVWAEHRAATRAG
jgi:hypothetical protein